MSEDKTNPKRSQNTSKNPSGSLPKRSGLAQRRLEQLLDKKTLRPEIEKQAQTLQPDSGTGEAGITINLTSKELEKLNSLVLEAGQRGEIGRGKVKDVIDLTVKAFRLTSSDSNEIQKSNSKTKSSEAKALKRDNFTEKELSASITPQMIIDAGKEMHEVYNDYQFASEIAKKQLTPTSFLKAANKVLGIDYFDDELDLGQAAWKIAKTGGKSGLGLVGVAQYLHAGDLNQGADIRPPNKPNPADWSDSDIAKTSSPEIIKRGQEEKQNAKWHQQLIKLREEARNHRVAEKAEELRKRKSGSIGIAGKDYNASNIQKGSEANCFAARQALKDALKTQIMNWEKYSPFSEQLVSINKTIDSLNKRYDVVAEGGMYWGKPEALEIDQQRYRLRAELAQLLEKHNLKHQEMMETYKKTDSMSCEDVTKNVQKYSV